MRETTPASPTLDLLSQPAEWSRMTECQLADLLSLGCAAYGWRTDPLRGKHLRQFYLHAVEVLRPEQRAEVVVGLMRPLEQLAREDRDPVNAMVPFLALDPDPVVVSTAAMQSAQLASLSNGDPMTGPRGVMELALAIADATVQGAMLAGLAALGDARAFELLDSQWRRVSRGAQKRLFGLMSRQPATVAGIEFLVTRLERSGDEDREHLIGSIAPVLARLAESAASADAARPLTKAGVPDVERVFPSWTVPPDQSAPLVRGIYTVAEIGSRIVPRLKQLAAYERGPGVLPIAISAWSDEHGRIDRP